MNIISTILMIGCLLTNNPLEFETKASYYGDKFHGKPVACFKNEKFNMNDFTAAGGKNLKCGDLVRVTNLMNQKTVDVFINDKGNFDRLGRGIDMSKKSFSAIADLNKGIIRVKIEILSRDNKHYEQKH